MNRDLEFEYIAERLENGNYCYYSRRSDKPQISDVWHVSEEERGYPILLERVVNFEHLGSVSSFDADGKSESSPWKFFEYADNEPYSNIDDMYGVEFDLYKVEYETLDIMDEDAQGNIETDTTYVYEFVEKCYSLSAHEVEQMIDGVASLVQEQFGIDNPYYYGDSYNDEIHTIEIKLQAKNLMSRNVKDLLEDAWQIFNSYAESYKESE